MRHQIHIRLSTYIDLPRSVVAQLCERTYIYLYSSVLDASGVVCCVVCFNNKGVWGSVQALGLLIILIGPCSGRVYQFLNLSGC